jgi:hypothetical protein
VNIAAIKVDPLCSLPLIVLVKAFLRRAAEVPPATAMIMGGPLAGGTCTTTTLGPRLPTGEELFIDVIEILLKAALATLLLATLGLLVLFLLSLSFVHIGEALVTLDVFIVLGSAAFVDKG